MANEEHLAILKQGVATWNQWRQEHADIAYPDLWGADLTSRTEGPDTRKEEAALKLNRTPQTKSGC